MPVMFYTVEEFESVKKQARTNLMALSQALCEATNFHCIREPNDAGPLGPGEYCDCCPSHDYCPYEFKQYSK